MKGLKSMGGRLFRSSTTEAKLSNSASLVPTASVMAARSRRSLVFVVLAFRLDTSSVARSYSPGNWLWSI
jgi:hypothetical protein